MEHKIPDEQIEKRVTATAHKMGGRLRETISGLVRIPSENTPPTGSEFECQRYVRGRLRELDLQADLYELASVPGLRSHAAFRHERDYTNRPNMAAVWPGSGGGRSLLLSGHIDTVPRGSEPWTRDPFGAGIEGNRLYGLGSNDMKGGIAAMLVAVESLREAGVKLRGDLLIETVVDEEFGGVNGTLGGRLRGHNADATVICEPTQQVICPAQMGGRTVHLTLRSESGGILNEGEVPPPVTEQLHFLLGEVKAFAAQRKQRAPVHTLYTGGSDPVPVWVTKVHCGGWGMKEPMTVPTLCRIELYWQAMPGEELAEIDREFSDWFERAIRSRPDLFAHKPEIDFPIVWLPGSAIDERSDLVRTLSDSFQQATGAEAQVHGMPAPCDMFIFHRHFNTPALLFGPRGGNTHAPDEWVDLESAQATVETLARFICRWCGVD